VLLGAHVVTESEAPIHVSGHAYQEEVKMMVNVTNPFYIVPVHGEPRHQDIFRAMVKEMGWPEHRVFTIQNGQTLKIDSKKAEYGSEVPWGELLIDQHGDVAVTSPVLGERATLGSDGVIVVSVGVDLKRREVKTRPEFQTRGFSGQAQVIDECREVVGDVIAGLSAKDLGDARAIADAIESAVKRTVQRSCRQRPMVIGVVVPEGR
jgi:ribonuclease J